MKDDTYGDRKQELPEITEVETESVKESTYRFIETVTVDPTTGQKSCREGFEISKNDNNKCVKDVDKVYVVELLMNYKEDLDYDIEASVVVAFFFCSSSYLAFTPRSVSSSAPRYSSR